MIFAILRLGLIAFVVMLVLYFLLASYSRAMRRKKLEETWDEEVKTGDREAYVEAGLADYEGSLRRKLIFLIFVVPYLVIGLLVFIVNFQ